jgi:hypothetical protein
MCYYNQYLDDCFFSISFREFCFRIPPGKIKVLISICNLFLNVLDFNVSKKVRLFTSLFWIYKC